MFFQPNGKALPPARQAAVGILAELKVGHIYKYTHMHIHIYIYIQFIYIYIYIYIYIFICIS